MDEKEARRMKAEIRRLKRLLRHEQKQVDLADRIVHVVKDSIETVPPIVVPTLPDVRAGVKYDETAVLLLTDLHIGKRTKTYGVNRFRKRLGTLREAMMNIINAQRSVRPIKKLVIAWGGDIADAESIYPGQSVEHIEIPVLDQIFTVGVPELTGFLLFCLENFEQVENHCVRGNHGRQVGQAKWTASKSTNWDFVLYKALEATTRNQERLHWNIATKDWKTMFKVEGEGFMLTHGAQIRRYYNLPFYGMTRQAMRWCNAYRRRFKLTHFLFGHFHSICTGLRFNDVVIYVNGSFVTDDTFAEEYIGVTSHAEQLLLGVHPKKGVSWRYALNL